MEKEDYISVQWAQEDVETSYSLLNNNNKAVVNRRQHRCENLKPCKGYEISTKVLLENGNFNRCVIFFGARLRKAKSLIF